MQREQLKEELVNMQQRVEEHAEQMQAKMAEERELVRSETAAEREELGTKVGRGEDWAPRWVEGRTGHQGG